MAKTMTASLATTALKMAIHRRHPFKQAILIRGVQYVSKEYQELLKKHGMVYSMSRKSNCWDNDPMESYNMAPDFYENQREYA